MKFGQKLLQMRIPDWAKFYIDYQELKYILKSHLSNPEHSDGEVDEEKGPGPQADVPDLKVSKLSGMQKCGKNQPSRDLAAMSQAFFTMLEDEINVAEAFYKKQLQSIQAQLNKAKIIYHNINDNNSQQPARIKALNALAHHLIHDIQMLVSFVELNRIAVRKITKKYSKMTSQPVEKQVLTCRPSRCCRPIFIFCWWGCFPRVLSPFFARL